MISVERARELLDYDPKTGKLTWKFRRRGIEKDEAGSITLNGYITVGVERKEYLGHRLAWLIYYGENPKYDIDHINGIKTDNRIENLRDVTRRENSLNKKQHRAGRLPGAFRRDYIECEKRWLSVARVEGKDRYIGVFFTELEAHCAYMSFISSIER